VVSGSVGGVGETVGVIEGTSEDVEGTSEDVEGTVGVSGDVVVRGLVRVSEF